MTAVPTTGAPATHSQSSSGTVVPKQRSRPGPGNNRPTRLLRDTPGRLTGVLALALVLIALTGIASVSDSTGRSTTIDDATGQRGRMAIAAFDMYRALSDADAAATSAFLPGLPSSEGFDEDYDDGIARAATAITTLSAEADSAEQATMVAELSASLPIYTGLVDTARTYYRQGLPLGLAYLRDASSLVQESMLPKIDDLQAGAMDDLSGAHDDATAFPWLAGGLAVLTLGGLVYSQIHVARRTNRFVNLGLAVATVAVIASTGWLAVSWGASSSDMNTAHHNGAEPLAMLSEAHIDAQRARADEALTLVAQGANTDYEAEYASIMDTLIGADGNGGTLNEVADSFDDPELHAHVEDALNAARDWRNTHRALRSADDNGDFAAAVSSATSTDDNTAGGSFAALDEALTRANDLAGQRFTEQTDAAASALSGSAPGMAVLCLIAMVAAALGMQRRISEYR